MDKAAAEVEVVNLWRALPGPQRRTVDQAIAFAATLDSQVKFETLGNRKRIIAAWVLREFQQSAAFATVMKSKKYPTI